ncbi:uncharacterized protein [Leptinotarsa decemlineata]|uniref:uncharacterized protein n=1 Tax=Leptinotarsa decemlineata TaxID=7539 RepID=UPI003D30AE74
MTSRKNSSNKKAGSDLGISYQIELLGLFALEALQVDDWEMTTEQENVGKFDDMVLRIGKEYYLMQAKYKTDNKLIRADFFRADSKNADFGIRSYFNSFVKIKNDFEIARVFICTNIDLGTGKEIFCEEPIIQENQEIPSRIIFSKIAKSYRLFDTSNIYDLKDSEKLQAKEFCKKFRFIYMNGSELDKAIENSIRNLNEEWGVGFSKENFIANMRDWFHMKNQMPLIKAYVKAFLYNCQSKKYFQNLDSYGVLFDEPLPVVDYEILNVVCEQHQLLSIFEIHDTIRATYGAESTLYLKQDSNAELVREVIDAFLWHKFMILFVNVSGLTKSKAKEILKLIHVITTKYKYKKAVVLSKITLVEEDDYHKVLQEKICFGDLKNEFKKYLLRKEIFFQGKKNHS